MKYCSKCGNELLDEAVICPKCGCPVVDSEMNVVRDNRKVRLKSASALNAIAFILNILCGVYFAWALLAPSEEPEQTEGFSISVDFSEGAPSILWFWVWVAIVIAIFALGIAIGKIYQKKTNQILPYIYILLSVLNLVVVNLAFPNLLYLVTCIWGIIFLFQTFCRYWLGCVFYRVANEEKGLSGY